MREIKTVGIIGAGALGGYFIWALNEKLGQNLIVIAEGDRKNKLQKDGIIINNKKYDLNVKSAKEAHLAGIDLLIVAVKFGALKEALNIIETVINENTIVLSPLNGVNSEDIILSRIGKAGKGQIVHSFMKISAERKGNSINFNGETTPGLYFGEKVTPEKTDKIEAIIDLFTGTPLHHTFCENITEEIWKKFALNVSNNIPQAIIGCGMGAYEDSAYAKNLLQFLREEVVKVAAAEGITLPMEPDNSMKGLIKKTARYSTLQDLDFKRHTEIDAFSGTVVELGKKHGIKTPYNEFAFNVIKALEEKNDGKFDY